MKVVSLLLLFIIPSTHLLDACDKFLNDIAPYQHESYYRSKVYSEHDWKSFYKLKEANAIAEPDNYDLHLLNAAVFYATNKLREEKDLGPFKFSAQLRDAAVVHTHEMVQKNFFDHFNNKTKKLYSPADRMKMFGVKAETLGENIDMTEKYEAGETTYIQLADIIVQELYNSPPHRKAMLSQSYTQLGCGAIFGAIEKNGYRPVKATQDFAGNF